MLGNLSKVLIKAPNFFNNNMEIIDSLNIIHEGYTLNSLNSYRSEKDRNYNSLYFRESDFLKHNFEPEINFNHNKRLSLHIIKSPNRHQSFTINKDIINLKKGKRFNTISKRSKYLLTDSKREIKPYIENNFRNYKINSIYKKTISENYRRLHTVSNRLLKDKIKICNNIIYNNNIKYNFYESPKNYKFLKIHYLKSQETLFQEKTDNKLKKLLLIKPQIKELLKEKNRHIVGKKDFLRYLNYRKNNCQNPFYESMKYKEEMKNNFK